MPRHNCDNVYDTTDFYCEHPIHTEPDQLAKGVTEDGDRWSIARYGALIVYTHNDDSDDLLLPTEHDACVEYLTQVHAQPIADMLRAVTA